MYVSDTPNILPISIYDFFHRKLIDLIHLNCIS